jgi:glycerol uptake facilitator protein
MADAAAVRAPGPTGTRRFGWQQSTTGELVAEFLGTLVLVAFGCGVVAMTVAALPESGRGEVAFASASDWVLIALGWGLAVTMAVYVAGGISGAHLNPAVTLAQAVFRGFAWSKVGPYMAAQLAGAFVGAALVFLVYHDAIEALEAGARIDRGTESGAGSFGIFATSPAEYYSSVFGPMTSEIVGTAFLVAFIFAVTDDRNTPVRANLAPVVVGFIVIAIGLSFGANTGYAINPVRDLGPRLFAWIAGWGEVAIPGRTGPVSAYVFVPIIAPLIGGLIGAAIYDKLIRNVLLARGTPGTGDLEERAETNIERG